MKQMNVFFFHNDMFFCKHLFIQGCVGTGACGPVSRCLSVMLCSYLTLTDAQMVFDDASGDPLTSQLNVSGLTLLLPYIISTRRNWSASKLRVFALANKKDQLEFEQRKYVSGFYYFCFSVGKDLSLLSFI
jgi:hypothetical protein